MPLYTVHCKNCHLAEDMVIRLKDLDDVLLCANCGEPTVRVPTCRTFILKGTCWAKDGYARSVGDMTPGKDFSIDEEGNYK